MEDREIPPIFLSAEGVEKAKQMSEEQRQKAWAQRAIETGYVLPSVDLPEKLLRQIDSMKSSGKRKS